MLSPLFAEMPEEEAIIAFVLITLFYLILFGLALALIKGEAKLIALGIVTGVAAIGYASLVLPGGPVVAPTLMKIAFLLVLGGIVGFLLKCGSFAAPRSTYPIEERNDD